MTNILNLISAFNTQIDEEKNSSRYSESLTKIKLFLQIIRLIVEKAKLQIDSSNNNKQMTFFSMFLTFSEKVQTQLYTHSNEIIKKLVMIRGTMNKSEDLKENRAKSI